jgi:hypothetical protein
MSEVSIPQRVQPMRSEPELPMTLRATLPRAADRVVPRTPPLGFEPDPAEMPLGTAPKRPCALTGAAGLFTAIFGLAVAAAGCRDEARD